ncbi:MAG: hypothetical protein HOP29_19465 [Phycisphaerales bacterium]|nr:hypothetical protein [Phycisphaerales bacterium]
MGEVAVANPMTTPAAGGGAGSNGRRTNGRATPAARMDSNRCPPIGPPPRYQVSITRQEDMLDRLTERDLAIAEDMFRGVSSGRIARKYGMSREMAWMIRKGERRPQIRACLDMMVADWHQTHYLRVWSVLDRSLRLMSKALQMAERGERTRDVVLVATTIRKVFGNFLDVEFQRNAERNAMESILDSLNRGKEPKFT